MRTSVQHFILIISLLLGRVLGDSISQPSNVVSALTAGDSTLLTVEVNSEVSGRTIYGGLIEFMAGPSEAAGNTTVDIIWANAGIISALYVVPRTIPAGTYHYRISCTTNSSAGDVQSLSIRTSNVVVSPAQFECLTSPPFSNLSSTSSEQYTALYITHPPAGNVDRNSPPGLSGLTVAWKWKDARNEFGRGISKLSVELVQSDGNGGWYSLKTAGPGETDPTVESYVLPLSDVTLSPGTFNIRVNYTNAVPEGTRKAGDVTSVLSEEFYIEGKDGGCQGLGKGSSSSSGGGSSSGGSNSSGFSLDIPSSPVLALLASAFAFAF